MSCADGVILKFKHIGIVHQWQKSSHTKTVSIKLSQAAVTDIQVVPHGVLSCGGDGIVKLVRLDNHLRAHGIELWYFWDPLCWWQTRLCCKCFMTVVIMGQRLSLSALLASSTAYKKCEHCWSHHPFWKRILHWYVQISKTTATWASHTSRNINISC